MTITAKTPIYVRFESQANMPALEIGELFLSSDTGRMVVGFDPNQGSVNFDRDFFPLTNEEVLTEMSPRNWGVFRDQVRNQDRQGYFIPQSILPGDVFAVGAALYDGDYPEPIRITTDAFSAVFDYQVFKDDVLVRIGRLRALGNPSTGVPTVNSELLLDSGVDFTLYLGNRVTDGNPPYYPLLCQNFESQKLTLLVRKTIVNPVVTSSTPLLPPKPNLA